MVDIVSNQQSVESRRGGMVVYIVLLLLFLFSLQYSFVSLFQLISIGIFVHPVCMITVLCVSPYIYCDLEMNNIM